MSRIMQICSCVEPEGNDSIYGLDEHGNLYMAVGRTDWTWRLIIPSDKERILT